MIPQDLLPLSKVSLSAALRRRSYVFLTTIPLSIQPSLDSSANQTGTPRIASVRDRPQRLRTLSPARGPLSCPYALPTREPPLFGPPLLAFVCATDIVLLVDC